MPRTTVLLAVLLGCSALALLAGLRSVPELQALAGARQAAEPRFLSPVAATRDCKPVAPVELLLVQTGAADGSVVELELDVRARGAPGDVAWELRLPAGATLLQGESRGVARPGADSARRRVRVRLDPRAALSRITLVASGTLAPHALAPDTLATPDTVAGAAGEEVQASRTLSWGDPQSALADALPARRSVAIAGAPRLAEVPTRHRSGR